MSVTITRVLEWCFSSLSSDKIRCQRWSMVCGGRLPVVFRMRDWSVSNCQKVFCLRGARYDMATYINPVAIHIIFCRVNILNGEATCSITEHINQIYPERGSTRRCERARAAHQRTTRDKCGPCLTVLLPLGHVPRLNEESTFHRPR